jgi:hypothetical protein
MRLSRLGPRPKAVMVGQNRGERIAMSDLSARPAAGGIFGCLFRGIETN